MTPGFSGVALRGRFVFLSGGLAFLARPSVAVWAPIPLRLIVGYGFTAHGFAKLSRGPEPPRRDPAYDRRARASSHGMVHHSDRTHRRAAHPAAGMKNFVFTNSIVSAGKFPVWSTGGGPANCAFHDIPLTTFNACLTTILLPPVQLSMLPLLILWLAALRETSFLPRQPRSGSPITMAARAGTIVCNRQARIRAKEQMARILEQIWMQFIRLLPA